MLHQDSIVLSCLSVGTGGVVLSALFNGADVHSQCRSRTSGCSAAAAASTRARSSPPSVAQSPGTAA